MNENQHDNSTHAGEIPERIPEDEAPGMQPRELDSAIIEGPLQGKLNEGDHGEGRDDDLARVQVGAEVYASDGAEVAIVEIVSPGHVGIRAGQPGRPIDLPNAAVARVSPDGLRVDITLSSAEIERFSGAASTGADHLAGQMGSGDQLGGGE